MIDSALQVLEAELERSIKSIEDVDGDKKVISLQPLLKPDGGTAVSAETLGLTLVNIEEERVMKSQQNVSVSLNGRVTYRNPELKLNLYLLCWSNFNKYDIALKHLSSVIKSFQAKNVFTIDNTPGLPTNIRKLIVDLHTMSFEQQNHLWGTMGAKYVPSTLYKIRMLVVQEEMTFEEQPPLTSVNFSARKLQS